MYFYLLRRADGGRWRPFYFTNTEKRAQETLEQELLTRNQTNYRWKVPLTVEKTGPFSGRALLSVAAGKRVVAAFLLSSEANPFVRPDEEKCPHQACPVTICLHATKYLRYAAAADTRMFSLDTHRTLIKLKNAYG